MDPVSVVTTLHAFETLRKIVLRSKEQQRPIDMPHNSLDTPGFSTEEHLLLCGVHSVETKSSPNRTAKLWEGAHTCRLPPEHKVNRYRAIMADLHGIRMAGLKKRSRREVALTNLILSSSTLISSGSVLPLAIGGIQRLYSVSARLRWHAMESLSGTLDCINAEMAHIAESLEGTTDLPTAQAYMNSVEEAPSSMEEALAPEIVSLRRSMSSVSLRRSIEDPESFSVTADLRQLLGNFVVSSQYHGNSASGNARQHLGNVYNINFNIKRLTIRRRHSEESFVTARTSVHNEAGI